MQQLLFVIHIGSLCFAGLGVLFADHLAFDWVRGKKATLDPRPLHIAHWIVTVGLSCLILSGLCLFWPMREYLVSQPLFWLKMLFVCALVINSFFIERFMSAVEKPFATLTRNERLPLMISGAVSTCSWLGAIAVALILF